MNQRRTALALSASLLIGCGSSDEPRHESGAPLADVRLSVDDLGVTHVYAESDTDAFFGAGYAMARDRLFDMEMNRREALGTTSEIQGEASLASDVASRAMNFGKLGAADEARARAETPDDAALVDAFVAGINARIAEIESGDVPRPLAFGAAQLDFVPKRWTAAQTFAIGKLLGFGMSNTLDAEILATALLRFVPDTMEALPLMMPAYDDFAVADGAAASKHHGARRPPGASGSAPWKDKNRVPQPPYFKKQRLFPKLASNNWAVSGEHTKDGRPLIAGDPHQPLTSPTRLWPVHINSRDRGGAFDVIGFTFPGTPSVELGHNAAVGWTATINFADVMDLWDVAVDPSFRTASLGGKPRDLVARAETIHVRKGGARYGDNADTEITIYDCPGFGVILPDEALPVPRAFIADGYLLLNWTGFSPTTEAAAYLGIDRAEDLDAFDAAVDLIGVGAMNFVAANAKSIDYRVHADVPDRGDPSSHPMPWHSMKGDDAQSLWTRGNLPTSKLPHARDPKSGTIVTANNDPFGFTSDGSVENDPYYYSAFFDKGFRAHRITEALEELVRDKPAAITAADMEGLQRDVKSSMADTLVPRLANAILAAETDPKLAAYKGREDLQALSARLAAWDRRFDRTSGEPVILLGLEWFAAKRVFEDALTGLLFDAATEQSPAYFLGALRNVVEGRFDRGDEFLPPGGVDELLLASLDDTAAWLEERFGSAEAKFTLSDVHGAEFVSRYGDMYEAPRAFVGGSADTINVSEAAFFSDGEPLETFSSHEGSLYRMVIGFGEDGTPEATLDFARGTREEPSDRHFDDQQPLWLSAGHVKLPFRKADVDARTTESVVLSAK